MGLNLNETSQEPQEDSFMEHEGGKTKTKRFHQPQSSSLEFLPSLFSFLYVLFYSLLYLDLYGFDYVEV